MSWTKRQLLRGIYALLGLAAVCALGACVPSAEGQQQQQVAEVREEPEAPNVVLILTDDLALEDVNADSLEHMPNLRSLMEEGTTFENAFVSNSLCCPSRAT
nr:sulfatase-like hydrolase/transferase [Actinomycetota bacterium]